jgi:hypothetical protein
MAGLLCKAFFWGTVFTDSVGFNLLIGESWSLEWFYTHTITTVAFDDFPGLGIDYDIQ